MTHEKFGGCPNIEAKIIEASRYSYKQLTAGFYDEFPTRTLRTLGNTLYDIKAHIKTGKISETALTALQSGDITRGKLCPEHFYPRVQTALDLITLYYKSKEENRSEGYIQDLFTEKVAEGVRVHLVLSEENNILAPIQKKNPEKHWTWHYAEAGIVLVDDPGVTQYEYTYDNLTFRSLKEIAEYTGYSCSTMGKWVQKGFIEKYEVCKSQNSSPAVYERAGRVSLPTTTFRPFWQKVNAKTLSWKSRTNLERFFDLS